MEGLDLELPPDKSRGVCAGPNVVFPSKPLPRPNQWQPSSGMGGSLGVEYAC
jgi:hypothetical protein